MSLQLHRPDGRGGVERRVVRDDAWRKTLSSERWGKALPNRRLPELSNTEMNPTSTPMSVLFWLGLAGLTFVLLVAGYGIGLWHLTG